MPLEFYELSNERLFVLAEEGNHEACRERLIRNVMVVDQVEWDVADKTVESITHENRKELTKAVFPFQVGMGVAMFSGLASVPMVFSLWVARSFNDKFVTTDVPTPEDLETMLEVGAWTWNWMEPQIGVASFVLLTAQFTRAQMQNMGVRPYTDRVKDWRARRLANKFKQYDQNIIKDFARTASLNDRQQKKLLPRLKKQMKNNDGKAGTSCTVLAHARYDYVGQIPLQPVARSALIGG